MLFAFFKHIEFLIFFSLTLVSSNALSPLFFCFQFPETKNFYYAIRTVSPQRFAASNFLIVKENENC